MRNLIINVKRAKKDLPACVALNSETHSNIFLNEFLSKDTYHLLEKVKAKAAAEAYKYVWIRSGKLFV